MNFIGEELPTGFIGRSPRIVQIREHIAKLGFSRTPVPIQGETGSGSQCMSSQPEFDKYSASYRELLRDPVRDRFAANEFFHVRKRDLIRDYFVTAGIDPRGCRYLDVGCGKGELLGLLANDFAYAAGCDPSSGMLESVAGVDVRVQSDPARIPFPDAEFDFVTAVCVYHHVVPEARASLTSEIRRLLRPGGVFAIIEHNPWNPVTRLIVSRLPIDADAILLPASETRGLLRNAGLQIHREDNFLYLPEKLYRSMSAVEHLLRRVPLGGQYAVFARLNENQRVGQGIPGMAT